MNVKTRVLTEFVFIFGLFDTKQKPKRGNFRMQVKFFFYLDQNQLNKNRNVIHKTKNEIRGKKYAQIIEQIKSRTKTLIIL